MESSRQSLHHLEAMLRNTPEGEEFSVSALFDFSLKWFSIIILKKFLKPFQEYLARHFVEEAYTSLGWNHGPDDEDELRLRRALIASWACSLNVEACVSSALADYRSWLSRKKWVS